LHCILYPLYLIAVAFISYIGEEEWGTTSCREGKKNKTIKANTTETLSYSRLPQHKRNSGPIAPSSRL